MTTLPRTRKTLKAGIVLLDTVSRSCEVQGAGDGGDGTPFPGQSPTFFPYDIFPQLPGFVMNIQALTLTRACDHSLHRVHLYSSNREAHRA
jgi:hypothetical protein